MNQLQEMIEVNEDSEESSSTIKKNSNFLLNRWDSLRISFWPGTKKCALVAPRSTYIHACAIYSKVNGTPKGVYLPVSKLHSILAVGNLLAHNNLWLCYYVQVNLLRLKYSVASKWASKNIWGYHLFWYWWYKIEPK